MGRLNKALQVLFNYNSNEEELKNNLTKLELEKKHIIDMHKLEINQLHELNNQKLLNLQKHIDTLENEIRVLKTQQKIDPAIKVEEVKEKPKDLNPKSLLSKKEYLVYNKFLEVMPQNYKELHNATGLEVVYLRQLVLKIRKKGFQLNFNY